MINKLFKKLVDLIYGVERAKRNYLKANPEETIFAADGSKGIRTNGEKEVERGLDWVTSQRAVVLLTDKRVQCGKWNIPLKTIETAQLLKINSFYGQGQVLKLNTKDSAHYQFGMQVNPAWVNQNALPLTYEEGKVKTSVFNLIVRLILLGYIVYLLLKTFELI